MTELLRYQQTDEGAATWPTPHWPSYGY